MSKDIQSKSCPTQPARRQESGGGKAFWLVLGALAIVAVAANAKDIVRYIKISTM
jgi:hypothetical protein